MLIISDFGGPHLILDRASSIYMFHCPVAMKNGGGGGMAWPANFILLRHGGVPFSGIWLHELLPEGGTGPEFRDCKGTDLILIIHPSFSPSRTLTALCGWTLRKRTTAVTAKTMLRNLIMIFGGVKQRGDDMSDIFGWTN